MTGADLGARRLDGAPTLVVEQTEFPVRACRSLFHCSQCIDEFGIGVQRNPRDREVLERACGVYAVVSRFGDQATAERIALGTGSAGDFDALGAWFCDCRGAHLEIASRADVAPRCIVTPATSPSDLMDT